MEFSQWYDLYRRAHGLSPDPYDLRHQYDYEAAFKGGTRKAVRDHLPSLYKGIGHPRRFLEGIDTATGRSAKVKDIVKNIQIQLLVEELFRKED